MDQGEFLVSTISVFIHVIQEPLVSSFRKDIDKEIVSVKNSVNFFLSF